MCRWGLRLKVFSFGAGEIGEGISVRIIWACISMIEIIPQSLSILKPLQVDGDRQYYLSLRHGVLLHKNTLMLILKGSHSSQQY